MAANPTFTRHNNDMINFQFVGSYSELEDTKIKIEFGSGIIRIWEFDSKDDRDNAISVLNDNYKTDDV